MNAEISILKRLYICFYTIYMTVPLSSQSMFVLVALAPYRQFYIQEHTLEHTLYPRVNKFQFKANTSMFLVFREAFIS